MELPFNATIPNEGATNDLAGALSSPSFKKGDVFAKVEQVSKKKHSLQFANISQWTICCESNTLNKLLN